MVRAPPYLAPAPTVSSEGTIAYPKGAYRTCRTSVSLWSIRNIPHSCPPGHRGHGAGSGAGKPPASGKGACSACASTSRDRRVSSNPSRWASILGPNARASWWPPPPTPTSISRLRPETRRQGGGKGEYPHAPQPPQSQDPVPQAASEPQAEQEEAAALHQGTLAAETSPAGLALPALPSERLRGRGHQGPDPG